MRIGRRWLDRNEPGLARIRANIGGHVHIDAHKVERRPNDLQVLRREHRRIRAHGLEVKVGVAPAQDHAQNAGIHFAHRLARSLNVLRRLNHRHRCIDVFCQPHLYVRRTGADGPHRHAVTEYGVVPHLRQTLAPHLQTRRMDTISVTEVHKRADLIRGHNVLHAILQLARNETGIVGKELRRVAIFPTAAVLQGLRQIPVVQRREGLHAMRQQRVHEPAIEVDTRLIGRTGTGGKDAAPGNRKAAALQPQVLHQLHVLRITVEEVVRYVACVAVRRLTRGVRESVPDGGSASALAHRPFHLVGGRGGAPQKTLGKAPRATLRCPRALRQRCRWERKGSGGAADRLCKRPARNTLIHSDSSGRQA